jgi:hypothetical protein
MNEQEYEEKRRALNAEWDRALHEHGSQSIEYRRACRRMYRLYTRRIDYLPGHEAIETLENAVRRRYAWSFSDAINQALEVWAATLPELNTGE